VRGRLFASGIGKIIVQFSESLFNCASLLSSSEFRTRCFDEAHLAVRLNVRPIEISKAVHKARCIVGNTGGSKSKLNIPNLISRVVLGGAHQKVTSFNCYKSRCGLGSAGSKAYSDRHRILLSPGFVVCSSNVIGARVPGERVYRCMYSLQCSRSHVV
jgi:hypothetical protein